VSQRRPAKQTPVSIVVPTCANTAALERAIASILATRYEPLEVVVVENRPPASSTRRLVEERFAGEPVSYVEEPRRGASWARNTGLARADGDIVAFTDDDVVVDQGWIHSAVGAFELASDVACVTGRILPLALDSPWQRLFEQLAVFDKGSERRVFRLAESRAEEPLFPYVAGHVGSGANIFIRREAALSIGGFDPVLGPGTPAVGGEDLDLLVRFLQGGGAIVYEPSVIIKHDHPDCPNGLRRHAYRYGIGLTAMLGKQLIRGPGRRDLLRAIPRGVRYALNPNSRKNLQKTSDYPRSLDTLERLGMLLGPLAYVLSVAESAVCDRPWLRDLLRYRRSPVPDLNDADPHSSAVGPLPAAERSRRQLT
jgi:O-antigen biosynthesis protein